MTVKFNRSTARAPWRAVKLWQLYLGAGAIVTALYALVPPFKAYGPLMNALGLSAVMAVLYGVRRHQPRSRAPWLLFALGLFLFWLGDVYTYSYPQLLHITVPFPSFGDAVYPAVYPALMAGLLVLVRRRNPERDRTGVIDSLIMTLGLSLVSWIALIAPYIHDSSLSLLPKLVSIAYPIGDIILLAAAVRLAVDSGKRQPAFYLLFLSIVTLLMTDFTYAVLTLHNAYDHQMILNVGWIAFYLFWGAAALHPSMREIEHHAPDRQPTLTPLRLVLLGAATLVAPAIELAQEARRGDIDLVMTIGVSGVLFALVVARMAGLVRARERYIARERALAAAASDIMAATSRDQICQAALGAAPSLVNGSVVARLCFVDCNPAEHVALGVESTQEIESWPISAETWSSLLAHAGPHGGMVVVLTDDDRAALRLLGDATGVFVVELSLTGARRTRGLFLLAGEDATSQAAQSALVALATQLSLALESNALTQELHLQSSEARFRSLVQNTHDLITVVDANATVVYQSPSIEAALGYTPDELVGTRFDRLALAAESVQLLRLLADGPAHAGSKAELIECTLCHQDGSPRRYEILHTNLLEDEAVAGIVLNGRDISERKAFEQQLEHQAFHDPVTGLANRALFNERVRHALARSRREHAGVGVIFLDLDDFKTINDSLGHAAGDRVLLEVAKRLATSIRVTDTAARFGGDEFAILLEHNTSVQEAAEIAERIVELLRTPLHLEGKEIVVQASLGISLVESESSVDADELIRNADAAMYIAKRDGKHSYRLFEPGMHANVLARLELRTDLQRALLNDEFELYYQPVMRLSDSTVSGVEALIRWRHPERGLVAPDDFIPFAEETGLIIPIGRWVLREGCRQAKLMQDEVANGSPLTMAINISVNQLHHSDIVADVRDALAESGLDPHNLTLEITETVMMTDADLAEQRLNELKALGLRIALDDFGTGYSSLGYLARFPVDVVKMDRSFLAAGSVPVSSGLATAVVALGETFELSVVAEGIEFPDQLSTLRELGCELGQGYYFAKPMDSNAMLEYLGCTPSVPIAASAG